MTGIVPQEPIVQAPPTPIVEAPVSPAPIAVQPVPNKKFSALLLILVPILIGTAVIGIYVMLQARTMYQEAIATPTPSPSPIASVDPTADWQTYTNNLFLFSFKYPSKYSLTDNLQQSLDPLAWTTKKTLALTNSENNCTVSLMVNPDGFGPWFPNKTLAVESNGRNGLAITSETENTENLTEGLYQIIVTGTVADGKVNGLWMSANCPDTPQRISYLDATTNLILSTFKFTN
jgi:hypothetical protein